MTSRVAVEDTEVGGVPIKAGEGVLTLGNAANHDPDVFADPDGLDIDRGARNHVAFGFGAHQCLGQNLARVELQIVFDTLFAARADAAAGRAGRGAVVQGRRRGLRPAQPPGDLVSVTTARSSWRRARGWRTRR